MNDFGTISEPWWDDRPVWIIGGGPSLAGYDLTDLRARGRVVGTNRAAELVPCDATFTLDQTFIKNRADELARWALDQEVFAAMDVGWFDPDGNESIPGVTYLRRIHGTGVGTDPGIIVNGLNSGYGALCLAILKRARDIFLLGYDLRENAHWHDGYPWQKRGGGMSIYYDRWAARFADIRRDLPGGVTVWNCNPSSAVTAFPFLSYEDIGLPRLQEAADVVH